MNQIVQKSTPEENAVIQNLASLVQQLQAMGVGDQAFGAPGQNPGEMGGGQPMQGAGFQSGQPPQKAPPPQLPPPLQVEAEPQDEEPQNDEPQQGPKSRSPMMKKQFIQKSDDMDADDENPIEVEKAVEASDPDGTTATDDAEALLEDDLPEETEENINEIAKALHSVGYDVVKRKAPVRKSMSGNGEIAELRRTVGFLANTMNEMLEGLTVAKSADFDDPAETSVRKSNAPRSSYSGQGDIKDVLKALVQEIRQDRQEEDSEKGSWNQPDVVHKSMRTFTENLRGIAGGLWPK